MEIALLSLRLLVAREKVHLLSLAGSMCIEAMSIPKNFLP
jgi:hypothetical protein